MELFVSENSSEDQKVLQNNDAADDDEDDIERAVPITVLSAILQVLLAQVLGTDIVQFDEA